MPTPARSPVPAPTASARPLLGRDRQTVPVAGKCGSRSKLIDVAVAATVAGAFFVIFTKVVGCQQRLTEVEKELDDFKLTSSLQSLQKPMAG